MSRAAMGANAPPRLCPVTHTEAPLYFANNSWVYCRICAARVMYPKQNPLWIKHPTHLAQGINPKSKSSIQLSVLSEPLKEIMIALSAQEQPPKPCIQSVLLVKALTSTKGNFLQCEQDQSLMEVTFQKAITDMQMSYLETLVSYDEDRAKTKRQHERRFFIIAPEVANNQCQPYFQVCPSKDTLYKFCKCNHIRSTISLTKRTMLLKLELL